MAWAVARIEAVGSNAEPGFWEEWESMGRRSVE